MAYATRRTSMLSCNGDSSELVGFAENGESGFVQPLSTLTHSSPCERRRLQARALLYFFVLRTILESFAKKIAEFALKLLIVQHLRYCEVCIRVGSCNYDLHLNILTSLRHRLKGWRNQSGRSNLS